MRFGLFYNYGNEYADGRVDEFEVKEVMNLMKQLWQFHSLNLVKMDSIAFLSQEGRFNLIRPQSDSTIGITNNTKQARLAYSQMP